MRYFKQVEDGYIIAIGINMGGTEINEAEYNEIKAVIKTAPPRTETIDYRLKTDLTWESYEHDPDPEPEPTPDEVLSILLGGAE